MTCEALSLPRRRPGGYRRPPVDDDALMSLLRDTADAVRDALDGLDDWGLAGTRPGQYRSDLAADAAARCPCSIGPVSACCPRSPGAIAPRPSSPS